MTHKVASARNKRGLVFTAPRRVAAKRGLLSVFLGAVSAAGCQPIETRFEITSLKNPGVPQAFSERFDRASFAVNARNNWDIVFEIRPTALRIQPANPVTAEPTTAPASSQTLPSPAEPEEVMMSQFIHVNVFWRPIPGRSFVESTQTDATIIYCLVTDRDVIAYQGAGFVYFTLSRDGKTLEGQIESSDLVPAHYVNRPVDVFGPCRIQGTFTAKLDRRHVVAVCQRLRKLIGPPTAPLTPLTPADNH